jgi:hypothetical protein
VCDSYDVLRALDTNFAVWWKQQGPSAQAALVDLSLTVLRLFDEIHDTRQLEDEDRFLTTLFATSLAAQVVCEAAGGHSPVCAMALRNDRVMGLVILAATTPPGFDALVRKGFPRALMGAPSGIETFAPFIGVLPALAQIEGIEDAAYEVAREMLEELVRRGVLETGAHPAALRAFLVLFHGFVGDAVEAVARWEIPRFACVTAVSAVELVEAWNAGFAEVDVDALARCLGNVAALVARVIDDEGPLNARAQCEALLRRFFPIGLAELFTRVGRELWESLLFFASIAFKVIRTKSVQRELASLRCWAMDNHKMDSTIRIITRRVIIHR